MVLMLFYPPSPVRGDAAAIGESFETIPDRKIVRGSDGITSTIYQRATSDRKRQSS